MGFFSWNTQDTDCSIANQHSNRMPFTVYMHDDKGNVWKEDNYDGYGEFGGKDYYELVSEMNGGISDRQAGIDMAFIDHRPNPNIKYPNLTETPDWEWIDEEPENCEYQGYFYDDEDEFSYDEE
jgi:hypothetical protein